MDLCIWIVIGHRFNLIAHLIHACASMKIALNGSFEILLHFMFPSHSILSKRLFRVKLISKKRKHKRKSEAWWSHQDVKPCRNRLQFSFNNNVNGNFIYKVMNMNFLYLRCGNVCMQIYYSVSILMWNNER